MGEGTPRENDAEGWNLALKMDSRWPKKEPVRFVMRKSAQPARMVFERPRKVSPFKRVPNCKESHQETGICVYSVWRCQGMSHRIPFFGQSSPMGFRTPFFVWLHRNKKCKDQELRMKEVR